MIVPASCADAYFRIRTCHVIGSTSTHTTSAMNPYACEELTRSSSVGGAELGTWKTSEAWIPALIPSGMPCGSQCATPAIRRSETFWSGDPFTRTWPSTSSRSSTDASSRFAPISRICLLTTAAERRAAPAAIPENRDEYEPDETDQTEVWLSNSSVVATSSGASPSSSATTCATAVSCPCPCGAVPIVTTTLPLAFTRTCAQSAAPDFGLYPGARRTSGGSATVM